MALNPYTLYHLYEKGILDYVPMDLAGGTPIAPLTSMSNPYLEMAQQGGLYQNHGAYNDSFQFSGVQSPYQQNYQTYGNISGTPIQAGSQTNTGGMNTFFGYGVGANTPNTTASTLGFNGFTGSQTQAGVNAFGGFADVPNGIANGYQRTYAAVSSMPKVLLGAVAGIIGVTGLMMAFKRGKKPQKTVTHNSFWQKLNPKNWFSKKP